MDLEQKLIEIVREGTKDAFTLDHAERIAFSRFEGHLVSIDVAASILKVHRDTVRNYVKYGILVPEHRATDKSPLLFDLAYILGFHKSDLKSINNKHHDSRSN